MKRRGREGEGGGKKREGWKKEGRYKRKMKTAESPELEVKMPCEVQALALS